MARALLVVIALVGTILIGASVFVVYAVGIPALGLNPYGRPPIRDTVSGLGTALTLYLVGAALLATASRSIRGRGTGSPTAVFAVVGASTLVWSVWVGLRSGRLGAAFVLLAGIALLAPIALGFRGFRSSP